MARGDLAARREMRKRGALRVLWHEEILQHDAKCEKGGGEGAAVRASAWGQQEGAAYLEEGDCDPAPTLHRPNPDFV